MCEISRDGGPLQTSALVASSQSLVQPQTQLPFESGRSWRAEPGSELGTDIAVFCLAKLR